MYRGSGPCLSRGTTRGAACAAAAAARVAARAVVPATLRKLPPHAVALQSTVHILRE